MKIAVIGLGLMGKPIALRLQETGHRVLGWNRGREKREQAENAGIEVTLSFPEAVTASEVILTTLSDASAINETLFPASATPDFSGKTVLQMGTIAPDESRRIAESVATHGGSYLEAPVLGSIPEARNGTLIIMPGGDKSTYDNCIPIFEALGKTSELVGDTGQGAALKLAMNQLIASLTIGFSTSLGLVRAEGLEVEKFMSLVRESALYAPTFDKKLGKMLSQDYANPNFPLKHLLKDVRLFSEVASTNNIDNRSIDAFASLLESGESDHGEDDYSSLYELVNPKEPLIN